MAELEYAQPKNIKSIRNNIITFDSDFPEHIKQLGWVVKRGRVVDKEEMLDLLPGKKIIGVNDENLGKKLKSEYWIKRFKLVKLAHTDKEVKEKWLEIIQVNKEQFGIVEGYQPIYLYEVVDFEKPARSMQMGMMPAKLTHIMLNIGLSVIANSHVIANETKQSEITVYDPFVGSWTTGFLANHFGYDFIGSDIDISTAEKNKSRRIGHKLANPDKKFELFTHDIHDKIPLDRFSVSALKRFSLLIVTEWRLWPIITAKSTTKDVQLAQVQVLKLYESFLDRIAELKQEICPPLSSFNSKEGDHVVVEDFRGKSPAASCGINSGQGDFAAICTIPYYIWHSNTLEAKLSKDLSSKGLSIASIPEIYARKDQLIGRKILIIK